MIQITKDLVVSADGHSYIIGKPFKNGSGGFSIRDATYHSSISDAVQNVLKRALRQGVAYGAITTLRQFIDEQARLQAELERLIAPLEGGQERGGQEHEGT